MLRRRALGNIVSENLHNPDTDIADIYLKNGVETGYSGWSTTDWIPVRTGTYFLTAPTVGFVSGASITNRYNTLYDIEKTVLLILRLPVTQMERMQF